MTNHKIGLSQAQQRRNHRHVMWVCRERVMRWAVGLGYNRPYWNPNTKEDSKTMNRYLLDLMSDVGQMHRASTQMTLRKMIAALEKMPIDSEVINLSRPHSYRGYYCDLAFENDSGTCQAWELLAVCKSAIGKTFEGYKGGNYTMKESTPVWIAEYGCCGVKLIALHEGGEYETEDDD